MHMTTGSFITADPYQFHVEVKHRRPPPNRYTWEIRATHDLPVEESRVQFGSWEEASQAGKHALERFLQRRYADEASNRTKSDAAVGIERTGRIAF
jgi:hypothetical protein